MAERIWTAAQKNAIEAKSGTVLVSAAAGSGKTSVLVERIVRKLTDSENPVSPDSLLVVTFTNAAAAEMRSRIYKRIASDKVLMNSDRNERILLLSRLGEMQVSTMDSFCMALVKENFHLLGIDADFRMLEAGENAELKTKAAVSVLEKRFTENPETFMPLAAMFESGKNDRRLIDVVIKLSDFSMSEPDPEEWLNGVRCQFISTSAEEGIWGEKILKEVYSDLEFCVYLFGCAIKDIDEDETLAGDYMGHFSAEYEMLKDALARIKQVSWNEKTEIIAHLEEVFYSKPHNLPRVSRGYANNPSKLSATAKRDKVKKIISSIREYFNITEDENREDIAVISEIASELVITVNEFNRELLSMKKEISAFDFSDISHFALKLLYDAGASDKKTPLARELSEKFSEILIDEYQDTNRAQDGLFRSISKDGNNMFFVGDVKQSIYRFRLASPEIFIEKCDEFPYYDGKEIRSKIILGENFRSRKGILDTVNFIFSSIMSRQCGEIEYNDDERLNFPSGAKEYDGKEVCFAVLGTSGENAYETEAAYIADKIKAAVEEGTELSSGKKASFSDFCILMRSPSGIAPVYIRALKKLGIPVSSDVSQSFFETPEIKTIVSYLRVIDNPGRDTDLLAVMMSPLFGFSADDCAQLRIKYGRKNSLYSCVLKGMRDNNEKCARLAESINYYKNLSACSDVGYVLREIYSDTAYEAVAGAMSEGESRKKNLRLLLEKAENSNESFATLGGFVRYIEKLRDSGTDIGSSGGGDGVRIMSMHKSKGLEFPFVFIAGASKKFNKSDITSALVINHEMGFGMKRNEPENIKRFDTLSCIAVRKEINRNLMSEELRVYYVALTRAVQKLYIPVTLRNPEKKLSDTEYILSNCDSVSPYLIKHAVSAADWFLYAFLRHPDLNSIRKRLMPMNPKGVLEVEYIETPQVCSEEIAEEDSVIADDKLVREIERRASFSYKYAPVASLLSKHTASSMKDEHFDAASFGKAVPAFMFASSFSPADIGTFTHRFLQYCDFSVCKTDPLSECRRLVNEGRFTDKQASLVDMDAIKVFVNSDIMKRAEKALEIYREKQFTMAKSICETEKDIPQIFSDEKTVIIGKIDLVFTEDDGAVIVDYKTDNISDINTLVPRYRQQMELYAEALSKSMDIRVKECILYSLKLRKSISLAL